MTGRRLTQEIIGAAITVHKELGPGLLEAVYEACLRYELQLLSWTAVTVQTWLFAVASSLKSRPLLQSQRYMML